MTAASDCEARAADDAMSTGKLSADCKYARAEKRRAGPCMFFGATPVKYSSPCKKAIMLIPSGGANRHCSENPTAAATIGRTDGTSAEWFPSVGGSKLFRLGVLRLGAAQVFQKHA